jgi:hypothetical protein
MLSRIYRTPRSARLGLLAAACLLTCSCGDGRKPAFPVSGKVLHQGKPAKGAMVILHPLDDPDPKATKPNARAEADGSFRLNTYKTGDGAPAGEYAVTFFWPKPPASPVDHPYMGPDLLGDRYRDPKTSPWRVTIREGENELPPFDLK